MFYYTAGEPIRKPDVRDRGAAFQSRQQQSRAEHQAQRLEAVELFSTLGSALLDKTGALLPECCENRYPTTVVPALCLKQALSAHRPCQRVGNGWIARCVAGGLKRPSATTGGYRRARQRLAA